jgi:hypothetical protein
MKAAISLCHGFGCSGAGVMTVGRLHRRASRRPHKGMLPVSWTGSLKAGCSPPYAGRTPMAMLRSDSAVDPQIECSSNPGVWDLGAWAEGMTSTIAFNRVILRAVLRNVGPRSWGISVPDSLDLPHSKEVFRTILGGDGLGFLFLRPRQGVPPLAPGDVCPDPARVPTAATGDLSLYLWRDRSLGRGVPTAKLNQAGDRASDQARRCLGGRGAAPTEQGGGPTA